MQSAWDYAVVTVFITVGVPIMAVSLSLVANSIVQQGSGFAARSEFDHVMRILVTDKELAMLRCTLVRGKYLLCLFCFWGAVHTNFYSCIKYFYVSPLSLCIAFCACVCLFLCL